MKAIYGILLIAVGIATGIINALLASMVMFKLWGWFLAASYGPGPSYAAWFGITQVLYIVILNATWGMRFKKQKDEDESFFALQKRILGRQVLFAALLGVCVLGSWLTGYFLGWL